MKPNLVSTLSLSLTPSKPTSSHVQIAHDAEALWRELGQPFGCDDQIWFAAEKVINGRLCRVWARRRGTTAQRLHRSYATRAPDRSATSL